jgi:hypothetical protein
MRTVKSLLPKGFMLKALDTLISVLAIIALFYEIREYFPSDSLVILELQEELEAPFTYSLTGADSDQNYLLEYVKIYSYFEHPIKQATFKYDHYVKVDLKISKKEQPPAYFISKTFLEKEFGKQTFHFEFLDDNRFKFYFQFYEGEQTKPRFECQIGIINNTVPCKVVEKSLISSWYYTMGLSVFLLITVMFFLLPIRFFIWQKTKKYGYNKKYGYGESN